MPHMNTEGFIRKAHLVHGRRYSYEKTEFVNKSTAVVVTCPDHMDFTILPNSHLNGRKPSGCPRCSGRVVDTESFIEKATEMHRGFYDYSLVEYTRSRDKVRIICPDHGEFLQEPCDHIKVRANRGPSGCPLCGHKKISESKKDTLQAFLRKAILVHGDKYDYSSARYVNSKTDIRIMCPDHGEFHQRPSHHLDGSGCPACVTPGFYCEGFFKNHPEFRNKPALRYVVRFSKNRESFYKVGITTLSVDKRFAGEDRSFEIIDVVYSTLYECFVDEQSIMKSAAKYLYTPENKLYAGNTECFSVNPLEI